MLPAHIDRDMIPHKPGVYLFKDSRGQIIYVGKAIDLYHRVSSYFGKTNSHMSSGNVVLKAAILVEHIDSVETIIVESELEALILEANLIKKYLPQYNVSLKDDKDYLYIKITKEDFPKVVTARKHELRGSLKYFGPFPSSRTVRDTLKALRRVFPWCSVGTWSYELGTRKGKPCFYYHLGLCNGPCAGLISKTEYRKIIFRLSQLLDGKKEKLMEDLVKEMEQLSKQEKYEEAARVKKILSGLTYLTQPNRASVYLENPNFMEDQRIKALQDLQKALNLPDIPHRIECYDISNIQGHESTGSMVVLTEGEIDKSQYRKFKIRMTGRPNDVGMHREMMRRRLKHPEWKKPDLVIIDGGQAQVNGVEQEIKKNVILGTSPSTSLRARTPESNGTDSGQVLRQAQDSMDSERSRTARMTSVGYDQIPIFGLAKRMEWLYSPNGTVVKLPRSSPALRLLQKIRDEAHRFAITYHRKLHERAAFGMIKT